MAATLADKVSSMAFYEEPGSRDPVSEMWDCAPDDPSAGRDWAMMFGIACGIARTEDPWESMDDVIGRALEATNEAYERFHGSGAPRPRTAVV